jgi:hypothetical protein
MQKNWSMGRPESAAVSVSKAEMAAAHKNADLCADCTDVLTVRG